MTAFFRKPQLFHQLTRAHPTIQSKTQLITSIWSSRPNSTSTSTSPISHDPGCLSGIKILDFTRILAGPFCTQILADYGAQVIKVEAPSRGDETRSWTKKDEGSSYWNPDPNSSSSSESPISLFFAALNRSKRSLRLDLKKPEGRDVILRLVESGEIDIVVENSVPGTMERLGLGYETLRATAASAGDREGDKGLIYAAISGYGATGPLANRAGYDAIANAEAGLMSITGSAESGPVRAAVGLTDMAAGLYLHGAILGALYHRERTGLGQKVEVGLFETALSLMTSVGGQWLNLGVEEGRYGAGHPSVVPYNAWECEDGVFIVIAANSQRQFEILCMRLRKEEWVADERFVNNARRVENRRILDRLIAEVLRSRPHERWMEVLGGSGLAHGVVNTVGKAFEHPQVEAREMVKEVEWDAVAGGKKWKAIGVPVKFSETKGEVRGTPARLGEHNDVVLREAGYEQSEIDNTRKSGAFGRGTESSEKIFRNHGKFRVTLHCDKDLLCRY